MPGIIEFRRGNTATVASITPLSGELLANLDDGDLRVGDGSTAGGLVVGGRRVNAQTGTSYTVVSSDQGKLITFNNGSAVAVTMPQAGITNNFQAGATVEFFNLGSGTVTVTPTTSTINGNATLLLPTGYGAIVRSDGTNYFALTTTATSAVVVPPAYSAPTDGSTVTASSGETRRIIDPGSALTTLALVLPPSPGDGQEYTVKTSKNISTLTITGAAAETVVYSSMMLTNEFSWWYRSTGTTWF